MVETGQHYQKTSMYSTSGEMLLSQCGLQPQQHISIITLSCHKVTIALVSIYHVSLPHWACSRIALKQCFLYVRIRNLIDTYGTIAYNLSLKPVKRSEQWLLIWRHRKLVLYCIVLYCIVLYCIVLYCIVLYCIVLYCIVLYCIVLYCIVLYCIVLYCIVLYCIVLYCIVLYCIVLYCIVLYCIVLYCIVLYCIVLYCIVLYCIVLYCIVLYCTVLYCTVLYCTVLYISSYILTYASWNLITK